MKRKNFTGEEIAKRLLLHLTHKEQFEYLEKNDHFGKKLMRNYSFSKLWRLIKPLKLYYVKFEDDSGIIIMARNEDDACINVVPLLTDGYRKHSCQNPSFNESCRECREVFDELADKVNKAVVTWLGYAHAKFNISISTM